MVLEPGKQKEKVRLVANKYLINMKSFFKCNELGIMLTVSLFHACWVYIYILNK